MTNVKNLKNIVIPIHMCIVTLKQYTVLPLRTHSLLTVVNVITIINEELNVLITKLSFTVPIMICIAPRTPRIPSTHINCLPLNYLILFF